MFRFAQLCSGFLAVIALSSLSAVPVNAAFVQSDEPIAADGGMGLDPAGGDAGSSIDPGG